MKINMHMDTKVEYQNIFTQVQVEGAALPGNLNRGR